MTSSERLDDREPHHRKIQSTLWIGYRILIIGVVSLFFVVISIKILTSEFIINLSEFSFSDFLSLFLALFSIVLSLIFYLKATETSNLFYDNTYKFTNNVSEILGRIESGFSERLRHLDESYSRLGDKFDRIPLSYGQVEKRIEKEEETVKEKEEERDKVIQELLMKTQLQEGEKAEFLSRLKDRESELTDAKAEVELLRRKLSSETHRGRVRNFLSMRRFIRTDLLPKLNLSRVREASSREISEQFDQIKEGLPRGFMVDMELAGYLDEKSRLTMRGIDFLRLTARDLAGEDE